MGPPPTPSRDWPVGGAAKTIMHGSEPMNAGTVELRSGRWVWVLDEGEPEAPMLRLQAVGEPRNRMTVDLSAADAERARTDRDVAGLARDAQRRRWVWHGAEWAASVDRLRGKCGACVPGRWLHVDTPSGERFSFELAPGARLGDIRHEELVALVVRADGRS